MSFKVEVITESGSSYHVKNSIAHEMHRDGRAVFTDESKAKMLETPRLRIRGEMRQWKGVPSKDPMLSTEILCVFKGPRFKTLQLV